MLPSTLMRGLAFGLLIPQFDTLPNALTAGAWVLLTGAPQDLFIGIEAWLLTGLLAALLRPFLAPRRALLACILAASLFGLVHLYLLFDFLLYAKTGIRMNPAFFDFLPAAGSFFSSAWELGLGGLAVGLAVLAVWLRRLGGTLRQTLQNRGFPWRWGWALPVAGLAACFARDLMPAQLAYGMANRLWDDQYQTARAWLAPGGPLKPAETAEALALLRPRAERSTPVSPDYPLLKRTLGFVGPKRFDVAVTPAERPHVVFLFMESFRAADVGALGGRKGVSPHFDRLAREGVLFTNFCSAGVQTTRAVIGSLFGIGPCLSEKSAQGGSLDLPLIGAADLLGARGYRSAYLSGTSLKLESQADFFARHGYQEVLGDKDLAEAFPHAQRTSWGYHDQYVMDYGVDWLARQERRRQPAFLTLFTISHHHPWLIPADYPAPRFADEPSVEHARFLQTFHYSDYCLGRFIERLQQSGLAQRTVLFILGDHGAAQGEHHGNFMNVNYLFGENVHVPLLILAPGRLARPVVIDDPASQLDLLPTLMDLLGLTGLNHAVGASLVRDVPDRTVYFNNPFALQYCGLRQGPYHYVLSLCDGSSALYDLTRDPQQRQNLAADQPELCRRYADNVRGVNQLFLRLYLRQGFVGPADTPR